MTYLYYYIFEDEKDSSLSVFFRKYYTSKLPGEFLYAYGNRNFVDKINYAFSKGASEKDIAVIMNLVPDNHETSKVFINLRTAYKDIIIVPIICAEYCLLKSLDEGVFSDEECKRLVLSRSLDYKNCKLIAGTGSKRASKNFENFCKFVLANATRVCLKVTTNGVLKSYYSDDCPCSYKGSSSCIKRALSNKVSSYVDKFLLHPEIPGLTRDKIKAIINSELHRYNSWVVNEENLIPSRYFY